MSWGSIGAFLDMGGHGGYVWGAYAVTALAMALEPWLAARRHRRAAEQSAQAADEEGSP